MGTTMTIKEQLFLDYAYYVCTWPRMCSLIHSKRVHLLLPLERLSGARRDSVGSSLFRATKCHQMIASCIRYMLTELA